MKCIICKQEGDFLTTDGKAICCDCLPKSKYIICVRCGKVVPISADKYFTDKSLCADCFNKEE